MITPWRPCILLLWIRSSSPENQVIHTPFESYSLLLLGTKKCSAALKLNLLFFRRQSSTQNFSNEKWVIVITSLREESKTNGTAANQPPYT